MLFQLVPSMPRTEGTEFGLLLTPHGMANKDKNGKEGGAAGELLKDMNQKMILLKTPSTQETEGGIMEIREGANAHYKLRDQIAMLPTPKKQNANHPGEHGQGGKDLQTAIGLIHTPRKSDSNTPSKSRRESKIQLREQIDRIGKNPGMRLQPAFVEWMMGYEIGWTDLNPSEMQSSQP